MKKAILALCLASMIGLFSSRFAHAMEEPDNFVYVVHTVYENGVLKFNPANQFPYDIVVDVFQPTNGQYQGRVLSLSGSSLSDFQFNLSIGTNDIRVPYFSDAKTIQFFSDANRQQTLLTVDVQETLICNDNNACEVDRGETEKNCAHDCRAPNQPQPVTQESNTGNVVVTILVIVLVLLVMLFIGAAVYFYRNFKQDN